jgi:hypothetical protein
MVSLFTVPNRAIRREALLSVRLIQGAAITLLVAGSAAFPAAAPEPQMSYLDNGTLKIGVNLNAGGAITYLSKSGDSTNIVNNWDWGRQIQMSHYSGPVPFTPNGKKPAPQWAGLGWNPVQAGDHFKNPSKVLVHRNDGKTLYIKCVPMQYALNNVPAECTFECWITLQGSAAQIRSRMVVNRPDTMQYPARNQELPAVYTIGSLYKLMSYTGDKPFAKEALSRIQKPETQKNFWPWQHYRATENWAAMVNDQDWGLGIWEPGCTSFVGGFYGQQGKGGTKDDSTGYISPTQDEIIDHNIAYEYRYVLIVGTLQEIREHVYKYAERPGPPAYHFEKDRQHWTYLNAADTGWPIKGELNVLLDRPEAQLIGPSGFWLAKDAPKLRIEAAFKTAGRQATIFWKRSDDDAFTGPKSMALQIKPDGQYQVYELDLSVSPEYRGAITGLRFDPGDGAKGGWVKIKSISFPKSDAR